MPGFLDFVFSTPSQKAEAKRREAAGAAVASARGRSPGVGPFLPGQGGSGLLADPLNPQNQIEFASEVGATAPELGSQLLSGIFSNQSGIEQQQISAEAAGERQELVSETSRANAALTAQTSRENARLLREQQQAQFDASQGRALQTAQAAQAKQPQPVFNPHTLGMSFVPSRATNEGLTEWNKQQGSVDALQNFITDINAMVEDIETFGTEGWNKEVAGRMATRWGNIVLRAPGLRGAGAPQAAELEIIANALEDPTSTFAGVTAPFRRGERERMASSYRTFAQELSRSLMTQMRINPALNVNYNLIDPQVLPPEARAFLEANSPTRGNQLVNPAGLPPIVQQFIQGTLPVQAEQP